MIVATILLCKCIYCVCFGNDENIYDSFVFVATQVR